MFVVIAEWITKDGYEDEVAAAIAALVAPSRAENGCVAYQPHRDIDDSRRFLIYEEYVDRHAYEAHGGTPHFTEHAVNHAIPLLAERRRSYFEPFE